MPDPIERLRALLEAASPGPWVLFGDSPFPEIRTGSGCDVAPDGIQRPDARAIAAWMNLRGEVMALVEQVIHTSRELSKMRTPGASRASYASIGHYVAVSAEGNLRRACDALLAAIEREVPDA